MGGLVTGSFSVTLLSLYVPRAIMFRFSTGPLQMLILLMQEISEHIILILLVGF